MTLQDKVVVVTGAARGIGLALARSLLGAGARVALADIDPAALEGAATALGGPGILPVRCDVSRGTDIFNLAQQAEGHLGPISIWINNAGLARHRRIPDYAESEIDLMLDVNLKGTILGSQEALRRMIPRRSGSIVNVISTAALRGIPGETVYCAAKWGVRGFTQGLQEEAAAHGIRVIAVLPGGVDTAFWPAATPRPAPVEKFLKPDQVAAAVAAALRLDDDCVPREIVLRSIADADFSIQPP